MKSILLIILSLASVSLGEVNLVSSDNPRDQGSYLWNIKSKHSKDEIVVFSFRRIEKNRQGEVTSDDTYYTISTGAQDSSKIQILAVNPDHFRDIKEVDATWCLIHAHRKFFATGKAIGLIARGEFGQIKIGIVNKNSIEFTFTSTTKKAQDVIKQFELGKQMLDIITVPGFSMTIESKSNKAANKIR